MPWVAAGFSLRALEETSFPVRHSCKSGNPGLYFGLTALNPTARTVGSIMANRIPPTKSQILSAEGKTIHDVIAPDLKVLFCGVNPGLYSGATGHHFARPGNRFWIALFQSGFTPRLLSPYEDASLLEFGLGITNLAARTTRKAEDLTREELLSGRKILEAKIRKYRPKILAVLGIGAYRKAFDRPKAEIGLQLETIGTTRIWILANPSGLNANYQIADLTRLFRELLTAVKSIG